MGVGAAGYGPVVTDEPLLLHPLAPWPTLAERESGLLPPPEYYEDVPVHMERPLLAWVEYAISNDEEFARRVVTRLRASSLVVDGRDRRATSIQILHWLVAGKTDYCQLARPVDQLSVIDAIIGLCPVWDDEDDIGECFGDWPHEIEVLDEILADSGSAWRVDQELRGLYRRVEAPVVEAWQRARSAAEESGRPNAARFLAEAWKKVYGMHPEPTDGYTAAVKAVEAVAVPVVLPDKPRAIVHHVRTELNKHPERWRFVLAEAENVQPGEGSIELVVTMLDRLLRGETERHGVEGVNRPSTPAEAQAAVHLAAVLVQWFISGTIQPRVAP